MSSTETITVDEGLSLIAGLPDALEAHADLLRALLLVTAADDRFRALEVGCSIARGAADERSDIDAGLWVSDVHLDDVEDQLHPIAKRVGSAIDVLVTTLWGYPYLFVQFQNGVQLDLLIRPTSAAKGRVEPSLVLLDRDGILRNPYAPPSRLASEADIDNWSFHAWLALANLDKYLRRGSLWEAWASLEEARANLLCLHAARLDVCYPAFGLTSLLDENASLPAGLERTTARLDATDLRRAALACCALLDDYDRPLAGLVRRLLAHPASAPPRGEGSLVG